MFDGVTSVLNIKIFYALTSGHLNAFWFLFGGGRFENDFC
jgi:hypothetical protein